MTARVEVPSKYAVMAAFALLAITLLLILAGPGRAAARGEQLEFGVDMARRGLWAEALFRFERAALEDPGNPRILNNLAVANEAVGDFDKALDLYREAVELDPANPELKRNYARFVEFYQSFRPREKDEAIEAEKTGGDSPTDEEPTDDPEAGEQ